jgi:hypothetical protein
LIDENRGPNSDPNCCNFIGIDGGEDYCCDNNKEPTKDANCNGEPNEGCDDDGDGYIDADKKVFGDEGCVI